ncbi:MAG: hypothetical protein ACFFCV_05975 [Promethearchaeota archaeon]
MAISKKNTEKEKESIVDTLINAFCNYEKRLNEINEQIKELDEELK